MSTESTTHPEPSAIDSSKAARHTGPSATRLADLVFNRHVAISTVAVLMFCFFSVYATNFLTTGNLIDVIRSMSYVAIVAVGMTFLFISGELDLSVGSLYGFTAMFTAYLVTSPGIGIWLAVVLTIGAGALVGAINGAVTTLVGVPSFIVTLGMLTALQGANFMLSGAYPIALPSEMSSGFFSIASGTVSSIPAQVIWMVVIVLIGFVVLRFTAFGYHVYATGGNQKAARQTGISTKRIKLACFILTGALCGVIGVLHVGWLRSADPTTGTGLELEVIGAVIIGGTALFGGEGSVFGTLIGAAILAMLANGLVLLGVDINANLIFSGLIIVFAASLDVILRGTQGRVPRIDNAIRRLRSSK